MKELSESKSCQSWQAMGGSLLVLALLLLLLRYWKALANCWDVAWMGDAKWDVTIRSKDPISNMLWTHDRTSLGARASAKARRIGARINRPLMASYPGQWLFFLCCCSWRRGKKTAYNNVLGQNPDSAKVLESNTVEKWEATKMYHHHHLVRKWLFRIILRTTVHILIHILFCIHIIIRIRIRIDLIATDHHDWS